LILDENGSAGEAGAVDGTRNEATGSVLGIARADEPIVEEGEEDNADEADGEEEEEGEEEEGEEEEGQEEEEEEEEWEEEEEEEEEEAEEGASPPSDVVVSGLRAFSTKGEERSSV
jgi:hypothetical protein